MIPTKELIRRLQEATGKAAFPIKFWEDYSKKDLCTFQNVLDKYTEYFAKLNPAQKVALSKVFWDIIASVKTPIIEEATDGNVLVHFLFPRNAYDHGNKALYVAGDYHGFISTTDQQEMHRLAETDIMHRSDDVPRNSVIAYNFVQVDKRFKNQNRPYFSGPSESLPESFYPSMQNAREESSFLEVDSDRKNAFENSDLADKYSKYTNIECFPPGMSMFFANIDNHSLQIDLAPTDWVTLLGNTQEKGSRFKKIYHRETFLCSQEDVLNKDTDIKKDYLNKLFNDDENTRAVSIFEPKSGVIGNVLIINDGIGYMATNAVERLDKLMRKNKIPDDTAMVFISTLPKGLIKKYAQQEPEKYSGHTNVRALEFGDKVEEYIEFIDEKLLPKLGYDKIPSQNRTVVGSSMSGTASLFMILKHQDKFNRAIIQAPSYANRHILNDVLAGKNDDKQKEKADDLSVKIQLSCGNFDSLEYAQNLNLAHTQALAVILGNSDCGKLPIFTGNYGHLMHCWSQELMTLLPRLYLDQQQTFTEYQTQTFFSHKADGTGQLVRTPSLDQFAS